MRPIKLVMQAFGPFAKRQVLDFGELGDRGIFLIHGPTGAGKTSILDAICYALFGKTSGDERQGEQMRSDHAAKDCPTEVIFDFSLVDQRYRVSRSPRQERQRKRGKGDPLLDAPKATLWKRTQAASDDDEGEVLEHKSEKVTEKIEELLGFKADQFRQVVMLPQGQFRQLLTAASQEREDILATLFQTHFYKRIEEALKKAAAAEEEQLNNLKKRQSIILEQSGASSRDALAGKVKEAQDGATELAAAIEKQSAQREQAKVSLDAGREVARKLQEQEEAGSSLHRLAAQTTDMDLLRAKLETSRRAEALKDVAAFSAQASADATGKEKLRIASEKTAQESLRKSEEAAAKLSGEESPQNETARSEAAKRLGELERVREESVKLLAAQSEQQAARTALRAIEQIVGKVNQEHTDSQAQLTVVRENLSTARDKAAHVDALEKEKDRLSKAFTLFLQVDTLKTKKTEAEKALGDASTKCRQAEADLAERKKALTKLEDEWRAGQAAVLARGLASGAPCPVCGSTEHPSPALGHEHVPAENDLQEAKDDVGKAETALDKARKKENECTQALAEIRERLQAQLENLGEFAEQTNDAIQSQVEAATIKLNASRAAETTVKELTEKIATLEKDITALADRQRQLAVELERAKGRATQADAIVSERELAVPADLRQKEALEKAIQAARSKMETLAKSLEAARKAHQEAEVKLAEARKASENAQQAEAEAKVKALKAKADFENRLLEAGFDSEENWRLALMEPKEQVAHARTLEKFDADFAAAKDRKQRADEAALGLIAPDLQVLESAYKQAEHEHVEAKEKLGKLRTQADQLSSLLAQIDQAVEKLTELEASYRVIAGLSEMASGRNNLRLTFQRYVLTTMLDQVLLAATHRLRVMSKQRYDLKRDQSVKDGRKQSGLDLLVYDAYTGVERRVETLSGGEGFLAALSLALGLADVVQEFAGGVRLETMFIDEGFGSLDPEAMDLAFQALVDMQKAGRLVGLISHVPELKERIDARLEIKAGKQGSEALFIV